jgi:Mor family transcriptional regulator
MNLGRMEEKRNELFADLVTTAERLLQEYDLQAPAATLIANALADHLADHWGGQNMNIPKDYRRKLSLRELEVYDRFSGDNFDTLARDFGMTERSMRRLIARVRDRLRRNSHGMPQLF